MHLSAWDHPKESIVELLNISSLLIRSHLKKSVIIVNVIFKYIENVILDPVNPVDFKSNIR